MSNTTTKRLTFNQVFSNQHKLESERLLQRVDKYHQHHNIYFSRSNNPHLVDLLTGKHHRKRQKYTSTIFCYDYQCIEAIQKRLKEAPDAACTMLLGASLLVDVSIFSAIDEPVTLFVLLDADSYVQRSCTVNMSWCRRMWSLASRAHMISVTSVYYSVLGGAYCSLGKSNSKYAYKAGALAIEQIKLAKKLKDPILECKCWLYFAEDVIQLGEVEKAETIITRQKGFVEQNGDAVLKSMLEAVEGKLDVAINHTKVSPRQCHQYTL
ncbi:uncharacterized protein ATC70_012308 [Mucor velutinosus]|uniref:Uncharacterized protein n=1 Tax=Mucor velutinosus TaxID=708070 RepID=A0AAN7D5C6_9FUNG|nr:hypothetical protein ATC70_012308 [Mucor velutinosus]